MPQPPPAGGTPSGDTTPDHTGTPGDTTQGDTTPDDTTPDDTTPDDTTPGVVGKALSALGSTPLASAAVAAAADVTALLALAGAGDVSVGDIWKDKKWFMVAAVGLFLVAWFCNWKVKRATSKKRRRRWGTLTVVVYLASLFCVIVGAAEAQPPPSADFGQPVKVAGGKLTVTVKGSNMTGKQRLVYRVEWDGDPEIDDADRLGRAEAVAGRTIVMGPVATDEDVTGLAYITRAGDDPPKKKSLECGDYDPCGELHTTLPAAAHSPAHAEIGEPVVNRDDTMTFTVKGINMRADQKLVYRGEWDGDPALEIDEDVPRRGASVTRAFTAGPVFDSQELSVIAYISGTGGASPAARLDCGDARGCAEKHEKLRALEKPDLTAVRGPRPTGTSEPPTRLKVTLAKRESATLPVTVVVFNDRGGEIARFQHRIDTGPFQRTVALPKADRVRRQCVIATFDDSATGSCNGPHVTTVVVAPPVAR